jgi:hypothetical protein
VDSEPVQAKQVQDVSHVHVPYRRIPHRHAPYGRVYHECVGRLSHRRVLMVVHLMSVCLMGVCLMIVYLWTCTS